MTQKLCSPVIAEILSNLSNNIHVSNCFPGATVFIRSLTRPGATLVKAIIGQPEGFLNLNPGETLQAGDKLVASQSHGADNSPETAPELAVLVGRAPTKVEDITPVDIGGRVWQCGRHAYVGGAIPGATVELLAGGSPFATAIANAGVARLSFTPPLNQGDTIQVRQRVGGLLGPLLSREVETLPMGPETPLPVPIIMGPLMACRTAIRVEAVYEGADVTLTRKSGEVETVAFDLSGLWINLATPLSEANGWVKAKQDMPACRREGQDATATVGPPEKPATPFVYPLCVGTRLVHIENLERGAKVHIVVGADTYVTFASSQGYNRFDVDPLPSGTVSVQSFMCGLASDIATVNVDPAPAQIDNPNLVGPLFKCQRSVTVEGLKPGATVQIWSKGPSMPERPISDKVVAFATRRDVGVTTLIEGADVWAVQWACALARRDSGPQSVWPAPAIDDPSFVQAVTRIDKSVTVKGTVRDAIVEIRRQISDTKWETVGIVEAKGTTTTVPLFAIAKLAVDQLLQARQRYCSVQTPGRSQTKVVKPVPLIPQILSPTNGQSIGYGTSVTLAWSDPASGPDADRKAESFQVKVVGNGKTVVDQIVTTTTAALAQTATALYSTTFILTVTPRNSTGQGPTAQSTFSTPKAPVPSITATQDKNSIKLKGSGFAHSHAVEVDLSTQYSALIGSPQSPVEFNDNRFGKTTIASDGTGAIDVTLDAAQVLPPRDEKTGSGTTMVPAPPFPNAEVRISARNKPPIALTEGSNQPSNEVKITWAV